MASADDLTGWIVIGVSAVFLVGWLIFRRGRRAADAKGAPEAKPPESPKTPMSLGARILVWVFIAAVGAVAFWAASNGVDVRLSAVR